MTFESVLRSDTSILDAAVNGALAALPIILGIIANIVAFISFIAFVNAILSWFGGLVGYEALSLEVTCPSIPPTIGYRGIVAFLFSALPSESSTRRFAVYFSESLHAAELDHGGSLGSLRRRGNVDRTEDSDQRADRLSEDGRVQEAGQDKRQIRDDRHIRDMRLRESRIDRHPARLHVLFGAGEEGADNQSDRASLCCWQRRFLPHG